VRQLMHVSSAVHVYADSLWTCKLLRYCTAPRRCRSDKKRTVRRECQALHAMLVLCQHAAGQTRVVHVPARMDTGRLAPPCSQVLQPSGETVQGASRWVSLRQLCRNRSASARHHATAALLTVVGMQRLIQRRQGSLCVVSTGDYRSGCQHWDVLHGETKRHVHCQHSVTRARAPGQHTYCFDAVSQRICCSFELHQQWTARQERLLAYSRVTAVCRGTDACCSPSGVRAKSIRRFTTGKWPHAPRGLIMHVAATLGWT
jgi:hypothetical protein